MQITNELRILEVSATMVRNAPFKLVLGGRDGFGLENQSTLNLNESACVRYNIPLSIINLVGRILICSFESSKSPIKTNRYIYLDPCPLGDNELLIRSLYRKESIWPLSKKNVSHTLELSTISHYDGIHPSPQICPFYQFKVNLTAEEYECCKTLPQASTFKVNLSLQ